MAGQVANIDRALKRFVERMIGDLVVQITETLREDTPKDTSWAASNWVPQIASPREAPVGSKRSVSFAPQRAGIASAKSYKLRKGKFFISNVVRYIVRLNAGSSQKAPAMFVEQAIAKGISKVLRA